MPRDIFGDGGDVDEADPPAHRVGEVITIYDWRKWRKREIFWAPGGAITSELLVEVQLSQGIELEDCFSSAVNASNLFLEFTPGEQISLARVIENSELWKPGTGFVLQILDDDSIRVLVKDMDGCIGDYYERPIQFEAAGVKEPITTLHELNERNFGSVGHLTDGLATLQTTLQELAGKAVDASGEPSPVAKPMLVVAYLVPWNDGIETNLPKGPFTVPEQDWDKFILEVNRVGFRVIPIYGVDADRYSVSIWTGP